jgi:hypothetical protein
MGWKSTIEITRAEALHIILNVLGQYPNDVTNDRLSEVLEALTPDGPYNYSVVDDYSDSTVPKYRDVGLGTQWRDRG